MREARPGACPRCSVAGTPPAALLTPPSFAAQSFFRLKYVHVRIRKFNAAPLPVSHSTPSSVPIFRKIKMGLYPPPGDSIPLVPGTFGPWTNGGCGPFRGCGSGEPGLREPWNPTLLCPGGVSPLCSRGFPLSQLRAAQPRPPGRLHVPPSQIFTYLF